MLSHQLLALGGKGSESKVSLKPKILVLGSRSQWNTKCRDFFMF